MRFTLYGSPHSLPTYKVALMLRLCNEPFQFRYVSFQKGMHREPDFLALSRWGQVPVLLDGDEVYLQAAAIVEHIAETLNRYQGAEPALRRSIREWLYWDVDVLFPSIFACYGDLLGKKGLLPINVTPAIAEYQRNKAAAAMEVFDKHLGSKTFLCGDAPTIADIFCMGDIAFAEVCEFEIGDSPNLSDWAEKMRQLVGYQAPFDLLEMKDATFAKY
jgi:glutathione S-transferase